MADEQIIKLLEEIRDLQKEGLENQKTSIANQQESIARQKQAIETQKNVVKRARITLGIVVALLVFMFCVPTIWWVVSWIVRVGTFGR
jgi:DNA-binding protein H-NS